MHDQSWIAFHAGHIRAVVMNAMAVECQRRVTEQQHRIGSNLALECLAGRSRSRFWHRRVCARMFSIDDVMLLAQRDALCISDLMAHGNEYQGATTPLLAADIRNAGCPSDRFADSQRMVEFEATAGEHAPRQRHRWQEAAAFRVSVRSRLA